MDMTLICQRKIADDSVPRSFPANTLMSIVLASSSPHRKALLARLQVPFTTCTPAIDEEQLTDENGFELVARLAHSKASAVAANHPHAIIIGSDQVATLPEGDIISKPGAYAQAFRQLRKASGNTLTFHTGLCVQHPQTGLTVTDVISTQVVFRELTDRQIKAYLEREQPYDCAGSFKAEGLGICLFRAIHSDDPTALIGLPLIRLSSILREDFNFEII